MQLRGAESAPRVDVRFGQLSIWSSKNERLCAQCLPGPGGPRGEHEGFMRFQALRMSTGCVLEGGVAFGVACVLSWVCLGAHQNTPKAKLCCWCFNDFYYEVRTTSFHTWIFLDCF